MCDSFTDMLSKQSSTDLKSNGKQDVQKLGGCPCAVKIATYGKAYKEVCAGRQVILFNGKPYYGCTRPCFEDKDKCWRHSTAKESLDFSEMIKNGGTNLCEEDVYFDKYRPKISKKSNTGSKNEFVIKINIKHKDLIEEIKSKIDTYFSNIDGNNSDVEDTDCHINQDSQDVESPFESSLTTEELEEKKDLGDGKEIINSLMEDEESDDEESDGEESQKEDSEDDSPKDHSDSESESESDCDSDASISCDLITTTERYGTRELGLNDKKIYDPEEGVLLGELIQVDDKRAPILHEDKQCIAGCKVTCTHKKYGSNDYMRCALTDRMYDLSTFEFAGLGKNDKGTWMIKYSDKYAKKTFPKK